MKHEIKIWNSVGVLETRCSCGADLGEHRTELEADTAGEKHLAKMFNAAAMAGTAIMPAAEVVPLHEVLPVVFDKPECKLPPPGWRCTREAKHAGPCAAIPLMPPPLTADELDQIHSALGIALNEGMVSDETATHILRTKVALLEAYLRSVPS